jgi:hypothetical protein
MATRREAADYYNGGAPVPGGNYPPPAGEPKYGQPPPEYQSYVPPPGPPVGASGEKVNFDQAFAIPKPKFHDWWAGVLFIAVFLGYTAVSGIAIHGYCMLRLDRVCSI